MLNRIANSNSSVITPLDVDVVRQRARDHVEDGAVTADYAADRVAILGLLQGALATELVCVLRYRRHHFMADGLNSKTAADEFLEHSNEEQVHADQIARRITQLGGRPDFDPSTFTARSHADYVECDTLQDMVRENLVAERIAVETYRDMIRIIGDKDPTTRRMLEEILATEEEHADELASLLES